MFFSEHFIRCLYIKIRILNKDYIFSFSGSLARGGWFPRQFRGFVAAENPYDKRHIGSAARMGFVPLTKSDRDGYFFGEGGFKRNVQSLKQNQFGSPSNYNWGWGRQRE